MQYTALSQVPPAPESDSKCGRVGLKSFTCCLLCCRDGLRLVRALPPTPPARVGSFLGRSPCGQAPWWGPRPATPCSIPNGGPRWSPPPGGSRSHARPAERRGRARTATAVGCWRLSPRTWQAAEGETQLRLLKLLLVLLARAAVRPAFAGPYEDGLATHKRGDYATALLLWRPLADQGDADAQLNAA
jgi:hypothetical protein